MVLAILGFIALGVGTVEAVSDMSESDRLAFEETRPAVVQTVDQQPNLLNEYPNLGL